MSEIISSVTTSTAKTTNISESGETRKLQSLHPNQTNLQRENEEKGDCERKTFTENLKEYVYPLSRRKEHLYIYRSEIKRKKKAGFFFSSPKKEHN